jgi:hypothetical protein
MTSVASSNADAKQLVEETKVTTALEHRKRRNAQLRKRHRRSLTLRKVARVLLLRFHPSTCRASQENDVDIKKVLADPKLLKKTCRAGLPRMQRKLVRARKFQH